MISDANDFLTSNKKPRKIKPVGADGHRRRMLEKFLNSIDTGTNPRDIVEMLLYYSVRVRDTRDSAVLLMERFDGNLRQLLNANNDALTAVEGVGPSSAMLLNVVGELVRRLEANTFEDSDSCTSDDLEKLFLDKYTISHRDEVIVAYFDATKRLVSIEKVDIDLNAVCPSDIISLIHFAKHRNVTMIVVAHFTKDVDSLPTVADIKAAKYIESALELSNLTMMDYYVVNADDAISIKSLYS